MISVTWYLALRRFALNTANHWTEHSLIAYNALQANTNDKTHKLGPRPHLIPYAELRLNTAETLKNALEYLGVSKRVYGPRLECAVELATDPRVKRSNALKADVVFRSFPGLACRLWLFMLRVNAPPCCLHCQWTIDKIVIDCCAGAWWPGLEFIEASFGRCFPQIWRPAVR